MENVAGPQSLASHGKFFHTPGAATLNTGSPRVFFIVPLGVKIRFSSSDLA